MPQTHATTHPTLGPYEVGQIPDPVIVAVVDDAGNPRPIPGATVVGTLRRTGAATTTARAGSVVDIDDIDDGIRWAWAAGDLSAAGDWLLTVAATIGATVGVKQTYRVIVTADAS